MDAATRELLAREFDRYGAAHYDHRQRLAYADRPEGRDPARWRDLCERGWTALGLGEDFGGLGERIEDALPLPDAAGRQLWREPVLERCGETIGALQAVSAEPQCRDLLIDLVSGERELCFAQREPASGFAEAGLPMTRVDGAGRLHGVKCCVLDYAPQAWLLVTAHEESGPALYLLPPRAAGILARPYRSIDARLAADLRFEAAAATRLASAEAAIAGAWRRAQLFAAAERVGLMRGAVEATREHLVERRQFGQPLAAQPVLQHRLIDMHVATLEAGALIAAAARAYDAGAADLDRRLLILRVHVAQAARRVTQEAIQLHGGLGLCAEIGIGDRYRRALAIDSACGTADAAMSRLLATPLA